MIVWLWAACAVSIPQPDAPADAVSGMRAKPVSLTHHARCRMDCRHFDDTEVAQILAEGRHVPERSRHDGECPSHALEGTTRDGQRARMVFADCPGEARLVTAIDLGEEWPCSCD